MIPEQEIEYTVECLEEDTPIEGNVCATGDLVEDKEQEHFVRRELMEGNEWAWCTVKVTARWEDFEATDYLGCCSYKGKVDFMECPYYADMKRTTTEDLQKQYTDQRILQPQLLRQLLWKINLDTPESNMLVNGRIENNELILQLLEWSNEADSYIKHPEYKVTLTRLPNG